MEGAFRITEFQGKYRFLSNFWPCKIKYDGIEYPSVEHAYQAAKRDDSEYKQYILCASKAGEAKRRGAHKEPPTWHLRSHDIMLALLRIKFSVDPLRNLLLQTFPVVLIEGNHWGDTHWGQCPLGTGENWLGKLLTVVRDELRESVK